MTAVKLALTNPQIHRIIPIPVHFVIRRGHAYVGSLPGTITFLPAAARNWCVKVEAEAYASRMNEIQSGWEVVILDLRDLERVA